MSFSRSGKARPSSDSTEELKAEACDSTGPGGLAVGLGSVGLVCPISQRFGVVWLGPVRWFLDILAGVVRFRLPTYPKSGPLPTNKPIGFSGPMRRRSKKSGLNGQRHRPKGMRFNKQGLHRVGRVWKVPGWHSMKGSAELFQNPPKSSGACCWGPGLHLAQEMGLAPPSGYTRTVLMGSHCKLPPLHHCLV